MFLASVDFVGTGDKLETIHQIIREYASEDPTYLNKFLYWITGKETLPHDGFTEFGRQLQVRFENVDGIESHTCSNIVYVVLPASLLIDDENASEEKLKKIFSKQEIINEAEGGYNQAGGSDIVLQLKNLIF